MHCEARSVDVVVWGGGGGRGRGGCCCVHGGGVGNPISVLNRRTQQGDGVCARNDRHVSGVMMCLCSYPATLAVHTERMGAV